MNKRLVLGMLLVTGCSSTWDQYPMSLYAVLREGAPGVVNAHQRLLKKLILDSEKGDKKPPPGMEAEYAYYSWMVGQSDVAREAIRKEGEFYPESRKFLGILERFLPTIPVIQDAPKQGDGTR